MTESLKKKNNTESDKWAKKTQFTMPRLDLVNWAWMSSSTADPFQLGSPIAPIFAIFTLINIVISCFCGKKIGHVLADLFTTGLLTPVVEDIVQRLTKKYLKFNNLNIILCMLTTVCDSRVVYQSSG